MKNYTFSVIIPAHNEEKYIGKCLRSILGAAKYVKPHNVEMIVVANRCTDKTSDIAKRIFTGKDREAADKFYYDIR